ncbi:MAG: tetratricopeptide repeat protein, partial [Pseudomonadota bacterium]
CFNLCTMRFVLQDLTIDPARATVVRGGQRLALPDLSLAVLLTLVEDAPAPVSATALAKRAWNSDYVSGETVAQRIALLRKALGDDPRAPRYIKTVRGNGYAVASPITTQAPVQPGRSLKTGTVVGVIGLAVVTAAVLTLWASGDASDTSAPMGTPQQSTEDRQLVRRAQQHLNLHQATATEQAVTMLREALAVAPESFEARLTLSFALSTQATKFQGDSREEQEAESLARALLEEAPDNSDAWSALGYTLSAQGRSDEALAAYRRAYTLDPDNTSALSSAAHLLLLSGDLQQALLLEARAQARGQTARYAEIQIAQALELLEHPQAEYWRQRALQLNPGQAVVLKELAASQLRQGQPEAALATLAEYEGAPASSPQLLVLEGRARWLLGEPAAAKDAFAMAGWRGHFGLALIDASRGQTETATVLLPASKRLSIAAEPDPNLLIQLAEVTAALNEHDEALRLMASAVSLGWRDLKWLEQSPALATLLDTPMGQSLQQRMRRELDAQRQLIHTTPEIQALLSR